MFNKTKENKIQIQRTHIQFNSKSTDRENNTSKP